MFVVLYFWWRDHNGQPSTLQRYILAHVTHLCDVQFTVFNFAIFCQLLALIFWATICTTVRPMLSYAMGPLSVCLCVCPVCYVGVLWPNGWMDQHETSHRGIGLGRDHIVLDGDRAHPPPKWYSPPIFDTCLLWPNGRPSQLLLSTSKCGGRWYCILTTEIWRDHELVRWDLVGWLFFLWSTGRVGSKNWQVTVGWVKIN